MVERERAKGPMEDGTCSCPSVETGTPPYGNLELYIELAML